MLDAIADGIIEEVIQRYPTAAVIEPKWYNSWPGIDCKQYGYIEFGFSGLMGKRSGHTIFIDITYTHIIFGDIKLPLDHPDSLELLYAQIEKWRLRQ